MTADSLQPHPAFAADRVLAILSPANLMLLEFFRKQLPAVFPGVDIIAPKDIDDLHEVIERYACSHRLVLVIGGDGTLHQVLQNLVLDSQVLGVLPAGTGNDVARIIDFPRRLKDRIGHLRRLSPQPLDFGTINGQRYINSAGFGIDSEVLRVMQLGRGFIARNYNAAFISTLIRLQAVAAEIDCDGEQLSGRYFWALCMNTPHIGGGSRIAPRAVVDDGQLDLMLVRETGKFNLMRLLPVAVKGRHLELPVVVYRQARRIVIKTSQPLDYLAIDGELAYCGKKQICIEAHGGELQFLR